MGDSTSLLEGLSPEVSLYYSRALVDESTAYFSQYTGVALGLGYELLPTLSLKASLSIDRELGAPIERFEASNTTVSLTKGFELPLHIGTLLPGVYVKLATNQDDVTFLSYEGSFGTSVVLANSKVFTVKQHHAFGGWVSLGAARNLYEYDANLMGGLNRLWSFGMAAALSYTLYERLTLSIIFKDTLTWFSGGKRDNDRYELSGSVGFRATDELSLNLTTVTSDRTFQYDQTTWNVNLYQYDRTMFLFSVAYAPKFKS